MPDRRGTDAVLALGERMLTAKGLNPIAVAAVRRAIENDRQIQERKHAGLA